MGRFARRLRNFFIKTGGKPVGKGDCASKLKSAARGDDSSCTWLHEKITRKICFKLELLGIQPDGLSVDEDSQLDFCIEGLGDLVLWEAIVRHTSNQSFTEPEDEDEGEDAVEVWIMVRASHQALWLAEELKSNRPLLEITEMIEAKIASASTQPNERNGSEIVPLNSDNMKFQFPESILKQVAQECGLGTGKKHRPKCVETCDLLREMAQPGAKKTDVAKQRNIKAGSIHLYLNKCRERAFRHMGIG